MEAFNEFAVTMEDRMLTLRNESQAVKGRVEVRRLTEELRAAKEETRKKTGEAMILKDEWEKTHRERAVFETEVATLRTKIAELEADRDRDIRRGSRASRLEDAIGFREVLASLEKRWVDKKKEVSAEVLAFLLHEIVTNLDLLNEIKNEGLVVEEEIVRLKVMEKDCEAIASLAIVPDWSMVGLDLPQVSEDSVVNGDAADSSSGEGASS